MTEETLQLCRDAGLYTHMGWTNVIALLGFFILVGVIVYLIRKT